MTIRRPMPDGRRVEAVRRIKEWTRTRFSLDKDVPVSVAELTCSLPGCPPLETVVTFWTAPDRRHAFKVFKPCAEVAESDLPPAFMKEALARDPDLSCC